MNEQIQRSEVFIWIAASFIVGLALGFAATTIGVRVFNFPKIEQVKPQTQQAPLPIPEQFLRNPLFLAWSSYAKGTIVELTSEGLTIEDNGVRLSAPLSQETNYRKKIVANQGRSPEDVSFEDLQLKDIKVGDFAEISIGFRDGMVMTRAVIVSQNISTPQP